MIPGGLVAAFLLAWVIIIITYSVFISLSVYGIIHWRRGRKTLGGILFSAGILLCVWNPIFLVTDYIARKDVGVIEVNLAEPTDLSWKTHLQFGRYFHKQGMFAASGEIHLRILTTGGTQINCIARQITVDYADSKTTALSFYYYDRFTDEQTIELIKDYISDFGEPRGGSERLKDVTHWIKEGSEFASISDPVGFENVLSFSNDNVTCIVSLRRPSSRGFWQKRLRSIQIRMKVEQDNRAYR